MLLWGWSQKNLKKVVMGEDKNNTFACYLVFDTKYGSALDNW